MFALEFTVILVLPISIDVRYIVLEYVIEAYVLFADKPKKLTKTGNSKI